MPRGKTLRARLYIKMNHGPARYYVGEGDKVYFVSNPILARVFGSTAAASAFATRNRLILQEAGSIRWGVEEVKDPKPKPIHIDSNTITVAINLGELLKHVPQQGDATPTFIRNRINDCAYIRAQLELALKSAGYQP